MTRNEQRLVFIFLIVAAAGLLFLFLNRYRFYYNYVKIAFQESEKTAVTADEISTDTGRRSDVKRAERSGEASARTGSGEADSASGPPAKRTGHGVVARAESGEPAGVSGVPTGKIDINRAGVNELMSLPGIGRVTALNIIEYRTRKGGFRDVQELIEVQGIGQKKLEALLDYVVVERRANNF